MSLRRSRHEFTLAVNRRSKQQEETDYIDIVAWDKLAETCNTYLKKGMSCLVEGRSSIRSYETKKAKSAKQLRSCATRCRCSIAPAAAVVAR